MRTSIEVKKEIGGKLLEANANEKYLYSRVTELEKRNQKLEQKVKKLKRKKKELKQEVAKLRGKIKSQGTERDKGLTGQDEDQDVSQMTRCSILNILPLPQDDAISEYPDSGFRIFNRFFSSEASRYRYNLRLLIYSSHTTFTE